MVWGERERKRKKRRLEEDVERRLEEDVERMEIRRLEEDVERVEIRRVLRKLKDGKAMGVDLL